MKPTRIDKNKLFTGRESEVAKLHEIAVSNESSIIIVHGRRRVGKTELIEQTFRKRNLLKFEGVEGKSEAFQKQRFIEQLATFTQDLSIANIPSSSSWAYLFEQLAKQVTKGTWTIYIEELQWMACYQPDLIAELKSVWDNHFRRNNKLLLILCGSSPSFFINHVIRSKALYNRSTYELRIKEFPLSLVHKFLGKRPIKETFNTYLSLGGIPEYLRLIKKHSSAYLALTANSFQPDSFLVTEFEKIFISSFAKSKIYRDIIQHLGQFKYMTRQEIIKKLELADSSGGVSERLIDLELSGFINRYTPVGSKTNSTVARYEIRDNYLSYYFRFIYPNLSSIQNEELKNRASKVLQHNSYMQWLGLNFEKYCRRNSANIAEILGFGAVEFKSGALFSRGKSLEDRGFQIDLLFKRKDKVWTVCEIKYGDAVVDISVVEEVERKISRLEIPRSVSVQNVLICSCGVSREVAESGYFDRVIGLEELVF